MEITTIWLYYRATLKIYKNLEMFWEEFHNL